MTPEAQALLTWIHAPTTLQDYFELTDAVPLGDLEQLMHFDDTVVARVAWLEWGRRKGLLGFTVGLTQTSTGTALDVQLDPARVALTPVLQEETA